MLDKNQAASILDAGMNEHDQDHIWINIKNLKLAGESNRFELFGGECFKVGRVIFTVREICNNKVQYTSRVETHQDRQYDEDVKITDESDNQTGPALKRNVRIGQFNLMDKALENIGDDEVLKEQSIQPA